MQIYSPGIIIKGMRRRVIPVICLIVLIVGQSLFGGEEVVRRGAQITGTALGLGVVVLYSIGPFTGLDYQEYPSTSTNAVLCGSAAVLGGSYLYTTLFADAVLESEAKPLSAGLEGALAGAMAGGVSNGLAFATMFAIGVPSGAIQMNEPLNQQIDTWYKGATLGFIGGFMYGVFFGALAGAVGGPVISFSMGF